MGYEKVKDLPAADFKRYGWVRPGTFRRLVEVVSNRLAKSRVFKPPGEKKLQPADHQIELVVVDASNSRLR